AAPRLPPPGAPAGPREEVPRRMEAPPTAGPARPVFVIGADRSGASALGCALGQHPALAMSFGGGWLPGLSAALEALRMATLDQDALALGVEPPSAEAFTAAF